MVALVLPLAGMTYTFVRVVQRVTVGAWNWSDGAPLRRAAVVATAGALAATSAYVLLPNGEYRPIQPGEKGTIQGGLAQVAAVPSGRPGLTEERESDLGGAPVRRDAPGDDGQRVPGETDDDGGDATTPAGDDDEPGATTETAPAEEPEATTGTATTPAGTAPEETTATETGVGVTVTAQTPVGETTVEVTTTTP
jgi:putative peptide zinc metalloprotease protein